MPTIAVCPNLAHNLTQIHILLSFIQSSHPVCYCHSLMFTFGVVARMFTLIKCANLLYSASNCIRFVSMRLFLHNSSLLLFVLTIFVCLLQILWLLLRLVGDYQTSVDRHAFCVFDVSFQYPFVVGGGFRIWFYLCLVTRKPVFWVFDQVILKPACSATEAS